jgi:hypothetical protein
MSTMVQPVQKMCKLCTSQVVANGKNSKLSSLALNYGLPSGKRQAQYFRLFSTSATPKQPLDQGSNHEEESLLPLYQRDGDRMVLPRAAVGISTVNTTYWLWYALDFIPAVNATPMQHLHIDPKIGWGALALGVAINALTALYPAMLVERLDYDPLRNQLRVYRYGLPLLLSPYSTNYPLGEISITPSDSELKKILGEYQGDWTRYKGHLALQRKGKHIPLLMEIQNGRQEVPNGEALLQAMLRPKALSSSSSRKVHDKQKLGNAKTAKAKRSKSTSRRK